MASLAGGSVVLTEHSLILPKAFLWIKKDVVHGLRQSNNEICKTEMYKEKLRRKF